MSETRCGRLVSMWPASARAQRMLRKIGSTMSSSRCKALLRNVLKPLPRRRSPRLCATSALGVRARDEQEAKSLRWNCEASLRRPPVAGVGGLHGGRGATHDSQTSKWAQPRGFSTACARLSASIWLVSGSLPSSIFCLVHPKLQSISSAVVQQACQKDARLETPYWISFVRF